MTILARGVRRARMAASDGEPANDAIYAVRKDGANFIECTKIEMPVVAKQVNARIWCDIGSADFGAACRAVRRFPANARAVRYCAGLAHTWHRSCFIGADRFVQAIFYVRP